MSRWTTSDGNTKSGSAARVLCKTAMAMTLVLFRRREPGKFGDWESEAARRET
jgi:hypothetical protein